MYGRMKPQSADFAEGQMREEKWGISEPFFQIIQYIILITRKHITSGDIFFHSVAVKSFCGHWPSILTIHYYEADRWFHDEMMEIETIWN